MPVIEMANQEKELEKYRQFAMAAATDSKNSKLIVNRDFVHASILIAQIFEASGYRVDILSDRLDSRIYGDSHLIESILSFLQRSHEVSIRMLLEEEPTGDEPLLIALDQPSFRNQFSFHVVPSDLQRLYECHLVIGDGMNFRFKPSRNSEEAFVRFRDPSTCLRLQSTFDEINKLVIERELAPSHVLQSA